jgi:hypothetical protein
MCVTCELAIVEGMTGNQFIDTFLIVTAGVFFVAAGAFLPFWEYTQGRGNRHHRDRHHHDDRHHGAGVSA